MKSLSSSRKVPAASRGSIALLLLLLFVEEQAIVCVKAFQPNPAVPSLTNSRRRISSSESFEFGLGTCPVSRKIDEHSLNFFGDRMQRGRGKVNTANAAIREGSEIIQGVGEAGCRLPSPSGINVLPESDQALYFAGAMTGLLIGTVVGVGAFEALASVFPGFCNGWRATWPILGAGLVAAGISHFTIHDDFCNIYPFPNAWGIWKIPFSASFHVNWTGVAEIVLGTLLFGGAYANVISQFVLKTDVLDPEFAKVLLRTAAGLTLLLLFIVTPANIFMWTHGARLPKDGPEIPSSVHPIRGALQIVLTTMMTEIVRAT
mmetsp:Transcript_4726/g.9490  ORF Transcript_4726/g.9490 Transcript_4726/m.9490 type:complete len:318 (+) Transcript_4726:129-1082(+)